MKERKVLKIIFILSFFFSCIIQISFFSNFDFKFLGNTWKKESNINLSSDTATYINISSQDNDLVSINNDPQLIWHNFNGTISKIIIQTVPFLNGSESKIFYTTKNNSEFLEKNSITGIYNEENNSYVYEFNNINVYDLRIDPTNFANVSLSNIKINVNCVNPDINFLNYINLYKVIIFLPFFLLFFSCLFFFYKKVFSFLWYNRYKLSLFILIIYVLCEYSGSSILLMNQYIQPNTRVPYDTELFGVSRVIRSDEWNVNTPLTLSQFSTPVKFSYYNPNFRATNTDMFISSLSAPIKDIVALSKPFSWGYFFLGAVKGFSFWWISRILALFLVTIEFGMIFTKKNKLLSFLLSVLITFSSCVHWWYSTYLLELLIFGQLCVVLLHLYLSQPIHKKKQKFALAVCLAISMLGFAAPLYPAWEIPLAIIYGGLGIILIVNFLSFRKFQKFDYYMLLLVMFIVVFILARFFLMSHDTIKVMSNTVYPGERFILGGNYIQYMFNYYAGIFTSFINITNPCEPSNFLCLYPLPILFACFSIFNKMVKREKNRHEIVFLTFLAILGSLFLIFPFPKFLAKITFFYLVPVERSALIVRLLSTYILVFLISQVSYVRVNKKNIFIATCLAGFLSVFTVLISYNINKNVFDAKIYLLSILLIFILIFSYFFSSRRNCKIFLVIVSVLSFISTFYVNPIIKGLSVVYDKPVVEVAKNIQENHPGTWITFSTSISNYLAIHGIPVINTVNNYPVLSRLKELDPTGEYSEIYNRYAHVSINLVTNEKTNFVLNTTDFYTININVKDLSKIGVKYIVSTNEINISSLNLSLLYDNDGILIYECIY